MDLEIRSKETITVAVIADTHIPDRVKRLHPGVCAAMQSINPDTIFHAGDISHPRVLEELRRFAPVFAVRGNRDFLLSKSLPISREFILNGVKVNLTHGHLDAYHYWKDKVENLLSGYQLERYGKRLLHAAPDADVVIFGHSHHAENRNRDGKIFFNPGSCSVAEKPDMMLSFGILRIHANGEVRGEIVALN